MRLHNKAVHDQYHKLFKNLLPGFSTKMWQSFISITGVKLTLVIYNAEWNLIFVSYSNPIVNKTKTQQWGSNLFVMLLRAQHRQELLKYIQFWYLYPNGLYQPIFPVTWHKRSPIGQFNNSKLFDWIKMHWHHCKVKIEVMRNNKNIQTIPEISGQVYD